MNKKKKSNSITIRIDDELYEKIKIQAETEHREISEFVRHTIQIYIEKIEDVKRITLWK